MKTATQQSVLTKCDAVDEISHSENAHIQATRLMHGITSMPTMAAPRGCARQSVTECRSEQDEKPLEGFENGAMETSAVSTNVFLLFFDASAVGRESDSRRLICRLVQHSERTMEAWPRVVLETAIHG